MSAKLRPSRSGITLIEVLLYVAISSILMLGLVSLLTISSTSRVRSRLTVEVDTGGLLIARLIEDLVKSSSAINTPAPGATTSIMSLTTPDSVNNPTVVSIISGKVWLQQGDASAIALTPDSVTVSEMSFSNTSSGSGRSLKFSYKMSAGLPGIYGGQEYQRDFFGAAGTNR